MSTLPYFGTRPPLSLEAYIPNRIEAVADVVAHHHHVRQEYELVLHSPFIAQNARPGQFIQALFGENYIPLVRRPFSIYRTNPSQGTLSILYLARGSFTSELSRKRVGDKVNLLGPLGKPFTIPSNSQIHHILVAGGIGVPPLYFLASALSGVVPKKQVMVLNAARSAEFLVGMKEFQELEVDLQPITDDGTLGYQGLAVEGLRFCLENRGLDNQSVQIYACGSMPMLKSIREMAIAEGLPCQVSIETPMACGIGLCNGCEVLVRGQNEGETAQALACIDGPIFEAQDLLS